MSGLLAACIGFIHGIIAFLTPPNLKQPEVVKLQKDVAATIMVMPSMTATLEASLKPSVKPTGKILTATASPKPTVKVASASATPTKRPMR